MSRMLHATSLAIAALALGAGATAGADFVGGSWMTFSNAISPAGNNPITNNSSGRDLDGRFSTDTGIGGVIPNELLFTGEHTFNAFSEVSFKIGHMEYFNGITFIGNQSVNGTLGVEFDVPSLANQAFNFFFGFTITPNIGDPVLDADILAFSFDGAPQVFTVDGVEYTLVLDGFDFNFDGMIDSAMLALPELEWARADVYATFTTSIPGTVIPLPGAAGLAFAGLVPLTVRRRRIR